MIEIRLVMAFLASLLFVALSLIGIALLKAAHRLLERGSGDDDLPALGEVPPPKLSEDPKLMALFGRMDPAFKREFPGLAGAGKQTAADVDLEALARLWPRLSADDRRELLAIANLKAERNK